MQYKFDIFFIWFALAYIVQRDKLNVLSTTFSRVCVCAIDEYFASLMDSIDWFFVLKFMEIAVNSILNGIFSSFCPTQMRFEWLFFKQTNISKLGIFQKLLFM